MNAKTAMTNKILYTLFIYICTLALSTPALAVEEGVSRELARQRSAQISDVRYTLRFDIPREIDRPVKGYAIVEFNWNGDGDVVLDFQGSPRQYGGTCLINKKSKTRYTTQENEHIIVPYFYLKKGRNSIFFDFYCGNKSLNRHEDFLYTLFVPDHARSVFPCFDQPDLKATFKLTLEMPAEWKALSNGEETENTTEGDRRTVAFATTQPLPTYLFSFTAGRFEEQTAQRDGRTMKALYRETDPAKTAQIETVFDEAALALSWMEGYTGIKYPFQKYAFVVLPGYQFGGMEHPGAIHFSDRSIFLGQNPSQDEELSRLELIAHETAHMWFGDLVTMRWFDDVWTKEVFANLMASKIARKQFPDVNHDLNFLKSYHTRAMQTDRTQGTHPIQQPLDNLNKAGLLYGNIIYDKAPIMMRKLEEQMGSTAFRKGLQHYLRTYAYKNASWDELIHLLDKEAPDAQLTQFSNVWVKQKGMPDIDISLDGTRLTVRQTDPWGRNLVWNQKFTILLGYEFDESRVILVDLKKPVTVYDIGKRPDFIVPNHDGKGYGRFTLDEHYTQQLIKRMLCTTNDLNRYALLLTLHENYLMGRLGNVYFGELFRTLEKEQNPLVASTECSQLCRIVADQSTGQRMKMEPFLTDIIAHAGMPAKRQHLLRLLAQTGIAPQTTDMLYDIWDRQSEPLLNERDYIGLAYRLALMRPQQWREIVDRQRARISNADLLEEFNFVSRACNPDVHQQIDLFNSLSEPANRAVEPWAERLLALLCCDVREPQNNVYIMPGLNLLQKIQQTGDIFFPTHWTNALLSAHRSAEAAMLVRQFLEQRPDYPENLKNKILEAAYEVLRK